MIRILTAAILALALPAIVGAQTVTRSGLNLTPGWTRATPPGAKVAGGFFSVANKGAMADRLIGGSSEISNVFEVHEMALTNGIMQMRAVETGLNIPSGARVELKPGGYHIMFMDLQRPLKEGETFRVELVFERAGKVSVPFKVMPLGATSAGHHGH